jgi:hypothetical protein
MILIDFIISLRKEQVRKLTVVGDVVRVATGLTAKDVGAVNTVRQDTGHGVTPLVDTGDQRRDLVEVALSLGIGFKTPLRGYREADGDTIIVVPTALFMPSESAVFK